METGLLIAYGALLIMALLPIYFGSWKSVYYPDSKVKKEKQDSLTTSDVYWFPVMASASLFGLYLVFKYFDKEHINTLFTAYFCLLGVSALTQVADGAIHAILPQELHDHLEKYHIKLTKKKLLVYELEFDYVTIASLVLSAVFSAFYAVTKNWIAANIFGLAFATSAVSLLSLDTFKNGMILLSGLFFYDIFWVFRTDVMVTVAKSFDAPIKVVFPKDIFASEFKHTMLGLGDIVIPGIFVALCLRFDQHLSKNKRNFSKPYFTAAFIAYICGLVTTVWVMHNFKAAQPALLYLSPACILSVLIKGALRGELNEVFAFSETEEDEKREKLTKSNGATESSSSGTESEETEVVKKTPARRSKKKD